MKARVTPFGLAVAGCLILAGWALWSGGILDGTIARQVRSSSVYAAPGVALDRPAAQRVLGNRRLVVIMLAPGADDLRQGCDAARRAAKGTLVLVTSRDGDEYDTYGCALLPDVDGKNLGKAAVAETTIGAGIDGFADRPLEALKVIAVNYDGLVKAGVVPDGARTISPSLPRYLIAAAAIVAVLLGAAGLYLAGRRAGRLAIAADERRVAAVDAGSALSAAAGVLAQQIIDLDERYASSKQYRRLVGDYVTLLGDLTSGTDAGVLERRVEALGARCRKLAAKPG
jgi:hypothetical protein